MATCACAARFRVRPWARTRVSGGVKLRIYSVRPCILSLFFVRGRVEYELLRGLPRFHRAACSAFSWRASRWVVACAPLHREARPVFCGVCVSFGWRCSARFRSAHLRLVPFHRSFSHFCPPGAGGFRAVDSLLCGMYAGPECAPSERRPPVARGFLRDRAPAWPKRRRSRLPVRAWALRGLDVGA